LANQKPGQPSWIPNCSKRYNTSSGVVNVVAGHVVVLMKKLKIWKAYTIRKNEQTDAGHFSIRNNTVFCSSSTDTICWL